MLHHNRQTSFGGKDDSYNNVAKQQANQGRARATNFKKLATELHQ